MQRKVELLGGGLTLIVIALLVGSCSRDGGEIGKTRLPGIRGIFVIEDDYRTTPLTQVQHSIYYVVKNDKELVFQGSGGNQPKLSLLDQDNILIRYCGGTIEKSASVLEGNPQEEGGVRVLRFQPVTAAGLIAHGRAVC